MFVGFPCVEVFLPSHFVLVFMGGSVWCLVVVFSVLFLFGCVCRFVMLLLFL